MMKTIISAFEQQVEKTPTRVGAEFGDNQITYDDLNKRANSLANYLVNEYGISSGDIVPLFLERNEKIIVAILAVLKTGACYTALSKQYPESRIDYIKQQTEAKLVIDDKFLSQNFKQYDSNLNVSIDTNDLAYIVYTSGTTGNPKGVLHTHKSVVSHIQSYCKYLKLDINNSYNMLLLVNYVFSVATTQIFGALFNGHTLVISSQDCLENIQKFSDYINEKKINYFQCTPSLADSLDYKKLKHVHTVAVAGEKIPKSLFYNTHGNDIKLVNVYGQSEFHAGTAKTIERVEDIKKIGAALDNMTAYVLDDNINEVAIGQVGEMCVTGNQLSKGYLKLEGETKSHFVSNPFGEGILCRTGDLVKRLDNDEFEFVGRNDFQLNINGIRTEPAEIEAQIEKIPEIEKSVVVGYDDKFIAAYYVSHKELEEEYIRSITNKYLPEYMQPQMYVWLEQLPLNVNGKLDRAKLPKIEIDMAQYQAPTTETEKFIVEAIEQILKSTHVGLLDNFFHLGGNSLNAMRLSNYVYEKTYKRLSTRDIFDNQQVKELAKLLGSLEIEDENTIEPAGKKEFYPMSPAQKRMFISHEMNKNETTYNEQTVIDFSFKVDKSKLKYALKEMIMRHESLRTKFSNINGEYVQEVMAENTLDFEEVPYTEDYSGFVKPLNLHTGQTMRVRLLQGSEYNSLFIDKHHIITDGRSEEIFYQELGQLYGGNHLNAHELHYKDYSTWFNELNCADERKWWNDYLCDYQQLELANDYKQDKYHSPVGKTYRISIDKTLVENIHTFAIQNGISKYMVFFSSISILLSKMYHSEDFILGTVTNGRINEATENMLGMFVNTLPIRVKPHPKLTVKEFINNIKDNVLTAISNQNYQFEEIVKDLHATSGNRNPLFDCMFVYQNTEVSTHYFDGKAKKNSYKTTKAKFPLTFEVENSNSNMELLLNYDSSLFMAKTIESLAANFIDTLKIVISSSEKKLSNISFVTEQEHSKLLDFKKAGDYKNVVALFENQVRLLPDDTALRYNDKSFSYKELNTEVNKLANYLIDELEVQTEQKIPLMIKRTHKMVIAILAVLKAGAAYVPISLKYPKERIQYILDTCEANFVIDDKFMNQEFPNHVSNPEKEITSKQLAYIIFTSGTSGKPKGVMVKHKNLSNYVTEVAKMDKSGMHEGVVNGAFFEYVFDSSIHDLVRPFTMGESVVILDTDLIYDIDLFIHTLNKFQVNAIGMTPSLAARINLKKVPTMQVIHCGGEAITQEVINKYKDSSIQLNNCYGPTETTVLSFVNNDVTDLSIGRPIGGVEPYVLEDNKQLLPKGAVGNLYIGGNQVTCGYVNQPTETAERYIKNPFGEGIIYDTGDLVRCLNDGSYQYLGRKDFQVKIRGYRVELGEIENKLNDIEEIDQVAVIAKNDNLVAYYVSNLDFESDELYDELAKSLPNYMIPMAYIHMTELPLTINGKLDIRSLPEPVYKDEYIAPKTSREKEIEKALCKVLGLEKVSINANFFRLGGNSIAAISLASLINIPVKAIFEQKTISNLAKVCERTQIVEKQVFNGEKDQNLSYAQERLFFIDKLEQGTDAYNIPLLLTLNKEANHEKLERAIKEVVKRHEILRTIIVDSYQKVLDKTIEITYERIDIDDFFAYSFDLEKEIPIKVNIYEDTMAINIHHIAFDGWSTNIFLEEIVHLYDGEYLEPVEVQYKDYAKWQVTSQSKDLLREEKEYWLEKLSGYETLDFPTDFPRPKQFDYDGKEFDYELDELLIQQLNEIAKEHNTSLFCVTLSAFMLVLSAYTNQKDIVLGTPIANRNIQGTENMIGIFVNTLVIRSVINSDDTFSELINQNNDQMLEAQKQQDLSFGQIVDALEEEKDLSRNPIFQITFGFQDIVEEVERNDLFTSVNEDLHINSTKFDISLIHIKNIVNFTFSTKLFKEKTIEELAKTYELVLKQIVKEPKVAISDIIYNRELGQKEKEEYPNLPVHTLFEKQAKLHPDNKAIVFGENSLTYKELNEISNQFAHTLIDNYGVVSGMHIPILMKRSEKFVIAIIGILKAGANYVPMSYEYPQSRIDYITKKVDAPFIVTDDFEISSMEVTNPNVPVFENSLAYIIFTSGTTGVPKGVMIEHHGIVNAIYNQIQLFNITTATKAVHFANFVFDTSVSELFYTLLAGATTYLLDDQTRMDYQLLKEIIEKNNISLAVLPPAILNSETLLSLNILIVEGESTPNNIYHAYENSGTTIVNGYGPTETTVCATIKIYEHGMNSNNIGKPLKNVAVHVLNDSLHEVPINAIGELFIGGVGLARGYIGDEEKTNSSFINHPKFGRLYKTGDLVKQLSSGDLIYIGRNDFQVKVRGFRIELGEIEAKLIEQDSIVQCLALVKGNNIVAYYKGELQNTLEGLLPTYMLPTSYVQLVEFPLTLNGKIDLRKLPEPAIEHKKFIEPENAREKEIAKAFTELLEIDKVSVLDDFYGLGGNSILALKLSNKINLQVKQIFEAKNIRNLAKLKPRSIKVTKENFSSEDEQVLSFAQESLWFIEQFERGTSAYNVPLILHLSNDVSVENLEKALYKIVDRHEILRTIITDNYQVVTHDSFKVSHDSISVQKYADQVFDLENEIPIRVNIFDNQLALVIHHIAFDGWSTELLLKELIKLYHGEELDPLRVQYKDYASWQRKYLAHEKVAEQIDFWKSALDSYENLYLPTDYERPKNFTYKGSDVHEAFHGKLQQDLEALARKHQTSLYTIMLSALDVMLAQFSYQQDIVVGTPFANRHIEGTEDLIGFFINTLPVRTLITEDMTFEKLIKENHHEVIQIQNHQDIPFEQIVKALNVSQDSSRNAIFQILFSVQDFSPNALVQNDLFTDMNSGINYNTAKYDLSVLVENGYIGFNYCNDLFKESTIQAMLKTYVLVLNRIIENDKASIGEFAVSDDYAKGKIVHYPNKTVVDLFKEQVARTPDIIAVEYQNIQLTYAEFDKQTNHLANYLLVNGVKPGDRIPLILERSEKMSIAIWGVLKAGCVYVPISPQFPEERKQYIIKQIGAKLIIDESFDVYKKTSDHDPEIRPSMNDLAYIIFTSGTTGKPKGVMIEHAGLSNRVQWMNEAYPITETDKIYQKTNYVFDVSVWEQVWALLAGARIVFALECGHKDPLYLAKEIKDKQITVMHFVPSMLDAFVDTLKMYKKDLNTESFDISSLKYVFCSGEALNVNSVRKFKNLVPNAKMYNLYGPTEASIDVTYFDCNDHSLEKVLIGKPVPNTNCYVLSRSERLLPNGAIGELALGGIQLARGYINQPKLTADKFIQHTMLGRIYKTGDLVRLLDTGEFEYLGRNDFQVKIHGLRIELGEIEARLTQITEIKQAVVLAVNEHLVAYYQADQELSDEFLELELEESLTDYMIPSAFVFMESFPLTINGKLDKKRLPIPKFRLEEFVPPETEIEIQLQEIIADILGLDNKDVSVTVSFFHLGGDSIKVIQLSNRIKQKLNQTITIKQIFAAKTIRNLSRYVGKAKKIEVLSEQGELTGDVKLLPIQEWFFEDFNSNYFNQAFAISLPRNIDLDRLKKALVDLVNYHDALRLSFHGKNQYYTEKIDNIDILVADSPEEFSHIQESFNLSGNLYRFVFKQSENVLAVICHHLIIDTVSWQIIASDLKELYAGHALPQKGTSYRQWSEEIRKLNTKGVSSEINVSDKEVFKTSDKYKKVTIKFDYKLTKQLLNKVNQVYNTQINEVLFTAFARALKSVHGQDISHIKLESHGRAEITENINIQRTVGWFTAIYPKKISTDLMKTKHYNRSATDYGVSYGAKYGIHSNNLPGILFNYLGQMDNGSSDDWSIITSDLGDTTNVNFKDYLTVNGGIFQKKLTLEISGNLEGIESLASQYKVKLKELVDELLSFHRTYLTSEDIDSSISQEKLNELQKDQELEDVISANTLQEGFIYHALNNVTNDDAYICSYIFDYEQTINVDKYRKAWSIAQKKYPSLRLCLNSDYEEILQVIPKDGNLDFELVENIDLNKVVQAQRMTPFDLKSGSLFRIRLIKHNDSHYTCVLTNHHAILDGWSNPLMLDFVNDTYDKLCKNQQVTIREDITYIKSQKYLESTKNDSAVFWKQYLGEVFHPDLAGLFKKEKHTVKLEEINRIKEPKDSVFEISGDNYDKLKGFANNKGFTINIIVQYAWHKLLSVYGGVKETTVGVVNAGRNIPVEGIEESVGLYIRTLPVQFTHTNDGIDSQLQRLQDINNDCMMHSNVSLASLQLNGTRLFETLFIYENYPLPKEDGDRDKLRITHFDGQEKLDYPITVVLYENEHGLNFQFKYSGEIFADNVIAELFYFMQSIIEQLIQEVDEFTYVNEIPDFGTAHYPETTIIEQLEKQVKLHPNNVALKFGNLNYSFDELNSKANQVAHTLVEKTGIKPSDRVPLLLEKSENMIIAIIAILKAGAIYVPMSPTYSLERIEYIKGQVKAKIVIDEEFMKQEFSSKKEDLPIKVEPSDLAYIIFTSGTTGRPKGVMVEHRNFIIYLEDILAAINNTGTEDIEFGCIAEYVFDIFGTEVFGQLLRGKTVNLFAGTPEEFPAFMKNHYVTTLQSTPGKISYLFQDNDKEIISTSLTTIMVGGEKMNDAFANRFQDINLINIYGPTEGTVWTSMKKVSDNYSNIGLPFPNYSHFVLDENRKLLPKGAVGELYVGGPQLSRGYYGQTELTEKSFAKNPYNTKGIEEYSRIYKTGDIVRVLPNDEFELIGRNDFQVKIRGFRIELGEIESAMFKVKGIKQVIALALGKEGSKHLGVYYQSDEEIQRVEIEKVLSLYLTDYMMPAGYKHVKEFPLTINGKIDRSALPEITYENNVEFAAPQNDVERCVLDAMCGLLDVDPKATSILESFFMIGGDSIKAIKLVNILKEIFNKKITIKEIFDAKTIKGIAQVIQASHYSNEINRLVVTKQYFKNKEDQKLSFAQQKYKIVPVNSYSNIKMAFKINEGIDPEKLAKVVIEVVDRQEILRTRIYDTYQVVDERPLVITHNNIHRYEYFDHQFHLENEIPIRVNIFNGEFVCVIDHVAFDGWSTSLFLDEIEKSYYGDELPVLPYQFRDFARCQNDFLNSAKKNQQVNFWREEFKNYEGLNLPEDHISGETAKNNGGDVYLHLEDDFYNRLTKVVKERSMTLHNVLLGTYYLMLSSVSGQQHIPIAIPTVNRNMQGLENVIGLFINQFLLTMDIDKNQSFSTFVHQLNNKIIDAQNNQDIPLEQLIHELDIRLTGNDVYFGIQGFKGEALEHSKLFTSISEMTGHSDKDAFCDLTIFVWGQNIDFNYKRTLFQAETIERFSRIYKTILEEIVNNIDIKIKNLIGDKLNVN
ncbi:non-ribosomal peptide synthetase [Clostridium akagii]|uniref:non-ribosomal peptide synthetase n=1 Tax=Clostridium akagii TaxID=91623 RepID=UPI00047A2D51|nr:non-ribosomal peptide synthetase [Clostridium akagii]